MTTKYGHDASSAPVPGDGARPVPPPPPPGIYGAPTVPTPRVTQEDLVTRREPAAVPAPVLADPVRAAPVLATPVELAPAARVEAAPAPAPAPAVAAPAPAQVDRSGLIDFVPGVSESGSHALAAAPPAPRPSFAPPTPEPAPPTPEPAGPAPEPPAPAVEFDEADATVLSARPHTARPATMRAALLLDDGRIATVTGRTLVGRNPAPRVGEDVVGVIRVADPFRSVSKTHLTLGVDVDGLWVEDRGSTNGTVVTLPHGEQVLCDADQQVHVPVGASVAFGDRAFEVVPG